MRRPDRKSTRLNSSHANISYAVFCLKKKKKNKDSDLTQKPKNDDNQQQHWETWLVYFVLVDLWSFLPDPRICVTFYSFFFFFNDTATTEIYTLSLHDALPI